MFLDVGFYCFEGFDMPTNQNPAVHGGSIKRLVLLIGAQGSGKSTYCAERLNGYTRISQDDQGKIGHREAFAEALEREDDFIVIDRMNHNRQQRSTYLLPAKRRGYSTRIVWLNTDRQTCVKRAKARKNHPTLKTDEAEEAINWYFKALQVPSIREADEVEIVGPSASFVPVKDLCAEIGDRRYIIVGDIHGCLDELKQLLEERDFNKDEDVLICVGDLVDRGPKVRETLEFVMSLPRFYSTKGNHDDKCVRYFEGRPVKIANGLQTTIDSFENKMPDNVLNYLMDLPLIIKTPAGYCVHAGFDPLMLPDEQQRDDCLYMRYYGGRSYFDSFEGVLWFKLWPKDYPMVFYGHIPEISGPSIHNIVSLDGGCVFGDYLKAWDSRDEIVHYINAAQIYSVSEHGKAKMVASEVISKREEYQVAGLLRSDKTDDGKLVIYTYTEQAVFDRGWDEITRNSRGHIFNLETGECGACPFSKFFNLGENDESLYEKFDWSKPYHIYEKMDGWLGVLYRQDGLFKVASRGSFHSDGAVWATEHVQKFDLSCLPDEATLVFEIINPRQKIILDYSGQETLMILAAFNRLDGTEYPREIVEQWSAKIGLPIVKLYDLKIDDCLKIQKEAKGIEGFVIAFEDGRRVKVKTDWYFTLAKIMSHMGPISIWESMANGKVQEAFMVKIPEELRPLAEQHQATLEGQYKKIRDKMVDECLKHCMEHNMDRKTIAMNRQKFEGTLSHKGVFPVLDGNYEAIDKMVMGAIFPKANEFVAL